MDAVVIAGTRPLLHRPAWFLAVLLALAVRALVPAGWMPAADGSGLVMCNGGAPTPTVAEIVRFSGDGVPYEIAAARAAIDREAHGGAPAQDPGDHPCAFAGVAPALLTPELAAPMLPQPAALAPAPLTREVAVGRGLSAPPPPQTGPPAIA